MDRLRVAASIAAGLGLAGAAFAAGRPPLEVFHGVRILDCMLGSNSGGGPERTISAKLGPYDMDAVVLMTWTGEAEVRTDGDGGLQVKLSDNGVIREDRSKPSAWTGPVNMRTDDQDKLFIPKGEVHRIVVTATVEGANEPAKMATIARLDYRVVAVPH